MKKFIIPVSVFAVSLGTSCSGGHHARVVRDTVENTYNSPATTPVDTSKVTSKTGEAGNVDNSASGGTKIVKPDTSKK